MRTMARASRTAPLSIVMESWLSASAMLRNAPVHCSSAYDALSCESLADFSHHASDLINQDSDTT